MKPEQEILELIQKYNKFLAEWEIHFKDKSTTTTRYFTVKELNEKMLEQLLWILDKCPTCQQPIPVEDKE